jgi:signal transduction histidine kinase
VAVVLACLAIVLAVAWGLLRLYGASRDRLDEAMGQRLLAVAQATAAGTDARRAFALSLADTGAAAWADSLGRRYEALAGLAELAEISLSDPEGRVLVSTSINLPPGAPHDWWSLDRAAVELACAGTGAASRLYRLQSTYQKSAHAPVVLEDPLLGAGTVVAVVTVSGSPAFFDALATGAAVLLVLLAGGVVLYRQTVAVDRARASLARQETLAAMGRMTAGIAHEIRNPLGIIRGAGEHLQRVLRDQGVQDETADWIPQEVDRLDRILSGYLAFGRDDAAAREVFDLTDAVRRGAGLLRGELARSGVDLVLPAGPAPLAVLGDPRRLQQVVLNLLLNARDAMPEGGTVAVDLLAEGDRAVVTVSDTGGGLGGDPERLFAPFHTTREKGSGLGLALSRRIVEDMGGSLDLADRRDGPGAVARISLPRHGADAAPTQPRKGA